MKYLSIAILHFIFFSCTKPTAVEQPPENRSAIQLTPEQVDYNDLQVGKISRNSIRSYVTATGLLDVPPNYRASVHTMINGYIKLVEVLPGEEIERGQVLATLSHPDIVNLQKDFLAAQALKTKLDIELDRKSKLLKDQITSDVDFQSLKSDVVTANATFNAIRSQLKMIDIDPDRITNNSIVKTISLSSPISGMVSEVNIHVGKLLTPEQEAFFIIDPTHKHLELDVFPDAASRLSIGQVIYFENVSGVVTGEGVIYLINPNVSDKQTVKVHGHLTDENVPLKIGDFVKAKIIVDSDSVFAVANNEIIHAQNRHFMFASTEQGFEKIEIILGRKDDQFTEILGPELIFETEVVLKGNYYLNGI